MIKTRKFLSEDDVNCNQTSTLKFNAAGKLLPRRILVAIDGSEFSENAFDWYLNNLRDDRRDILVLLHVNNNALSMPIHAGVDIPQVS